MPACSACRNHLPPASPLHSRDLAGLKRTASPLEQRAPAASRRHGHCRQPCTDTPAPLQPPHHLRNHNRPAAGNAQPQTLQIPGGTRRPRQPARETAARPPAPAQRPPIPPPLAYCLPARPPWKPHPRTPPPPAWSLPDPRAPCSDTAPPSAARRVASADRADSGGRVGGHPTRRGGDASPRARHAARPCCARPPVPGSSAQLSPPAPSAQTASALSRPHRTPHHRTPRRARARNADRSARHAAPRLPAAAREKLLPRPRCGLRPCVGHYRRAARTHPAPRPPPQREQTRAVAPPSPVVSAAAVRARRHGRGRDRARRGEHCACRRLYGFPSASAARGTSRIALLPVDARELSPRPRAPLFKAPPRCGGHLLYSCVGLNPGRRAGSRLLYCH